MLISSYTLPMSISMLQKDRKSRYNTLKSSEEGGVPKASLQEVASKFNTGSWNSSRFLFFLETINLFIPETGDGLLISSISTIGTESFVSESCKKKKLH